jgi:hypothetical protein
MTELARKMTELAAGVQYVWPLIIQAVITIASLAPPALHYPNKHSSWAVMSFWFNVPSQFMVGVLGFDAWAVAAAIQDLVSAQSSKLSIGTTLLVIIALIVHLIVYLYLSGRSAHCNKIASDPPVSKEATPSQTQLWIELIGGMLLALVLASLTYPLRLMIGG